MDTDQCEIENVSFELCVRLAPVYHALQKLDQSSVPQEYMATVANASRQYRGIIKDPECTTDSYDVLNEIWDLIEILMIDSELTGIQPGRTLEDLMRWCSRHNKIPDRLKSLALDSSDPFSNTNYFEAVAAHLLCGDLHLAIELLMIHPGYEKGGPSQVSKLVQYIQSKPLLCDYSPTLPITAYKKAFDLWQEELEEAMANGDFDGENGMDKIIAILVGEEDTIDSCIDLCGQWYRLLLAKCFYSCPTIDPRTVIHSSTIPTNVNFEETILTDLINRIFELDKGQALRDLVSLTNSWWPSAHLADLIAKADPRNDECQRIGEHFISNYANSLLTSPTLWRTGIRYLLTLEFTEDVQSKVNEAILEKEILDQDSAERLYHMPSELHLPNVMYLQRRVAERAARYFIQQEEHGSGLCWAIRANNDSICSEIAEQVLNRFQATEQWEMPQIINTIGNSDVFPVKLVFLYKYKQFHTKVREHTPQEAAEDLESLLQYNMKPETLGLVLRQAMVLLDQDFIFKRKQIICIMRALQKQKFLQKDLDDGEKEQAKLLRKSLDIHLTKAIVNKSH